MNHPSALLCHLQCKPCYCCPLHCHVGPALPFLIQTRLLLLLFPAAVPGLPLPPAFGLTARGQLYWGSRLVAADVTSFAVSGPLCLALGLRGVEYGGWGSEGGEEGVGGSVRACCGADGLQPMQRPWLKGESVRAPAFTVWCIQYHPLLVHLLQRQHSLGIQPAALTCWIAKTLCG